jgi:hypothetical protein
MSISQHRWRFVAVGLPTARSIDGPLMLLGMLGMLAAGRAGHRASPWRADAVS